MYEKNDFAINQTKAFEAQYNTLKIAIGGTGVFITLLSLIVGGIGIMNIMLVTVTERTKEIGVCMSVGAKKRDVLLQFLIESLMISLIGGFILNLMPCVFPVLSIKLMSVIDNKAGNVRISFFYTTLGILFSFLSLAIFFLLLKELNISIAWGMQFQEPYFLIFIDM